MIWTRTSDYSGKAGDFTIVEMLTAGVSGFLLYHHNNIVGKFNEKDTAKAKAEEIERLAVKV